MVRTDARTWHRSAVSLLPVDAAALRNFASSARMKATIAAVGSGGAGGRPVATAQKAQRNRPGSDRANRRYPRPHAESRASAVSAVSAAAVPMARRRDGVARAVARMTGPAVIMSIDSDILYPPYPQERLRDLLFIGDRRRLSREARRLRTQREDDELVCLRIGGDGERRLGDCLHFLKAGRGDQIFGPLRADHGVPRFVLLRLV